MIEPSYTINALLMILLGWLTGGIHRPFLLKNSRRAKARDVPTPGNWSRGSQHVYLGNDRSQDRLFSMAAKLARIKDSVYDLADCGLRLF